MSVPRSRAERGRPLAGWSPGKAREAGGSWGGSVIKWPLLRHMPRTLRSASHTGSTRLKGKGGARGARLAGKAAGPQRAGGRRGDKHKQGWAGPDSGSHTAAARWRVGSGWVGNPAPQHWCLPTRGVPGGQSAPWAHRVREGREAPLASLGKTWTLDSLLVTQGGARSTPEGGGFGAL